MTSPSIDHSSSPSPADKLRDESLRGLSVGGSSRPALSRVEGLLLSYFRSGWAFLIPYLAAYLLYAWLKGPVNAAPGEGAVKVS